MKRNIALILMLFVPVFKSFAQNDSLIKEKWIVSFLGSTNYGFRTLEYEETNMFVEDFRNENETFGLGYGIQAQLSYNFSNKLQIKTGLGYTTLGYDLKNQSLVFEEGKSSLPESIKAKVRFQYFQVPLGLSKKWNFGTKWKLAPEAGFILSKFFNHQTTTIVQYSSNEKEKSKSLKEAEWHSFAYHVYAGLATSYGITPRIDLVSQLNYHHGLKNVRIDNNEEFLYGVSFQVGVGYNF